MDERGVLRGGRARGVGKRQQALYLWDNISVGFWVVSPWPWQSRQRGKGQRGKEPAILIRAEDRAEDTCGRNTR